MKKNKIYVVEDMAMSRAALINMLTKNDFEVLGSAANAEMAWDEIQNLDIDLILLDINLAGKLDGIWLAEKIRKNMTISIVFLTAYSDDETLQKLSLLNPNGYLLKPYNKATLITTINIALQQFRALSTKPNITNDATIVIESGGKKIKFQISRIHFIQSDGNYIEIHLKEKNYIVRDKLLNFLDNLPENNLFRQVHLRYIININLIESITSKSVFINNIEIPVSKKFRNILTDFSAI